VKFPLCVLLMLRKGDPGLMVVTSMAVLVLVSLPPEQWLCWQRWQAHC
jgi:hypothetical protein